DESSKRHIGAGLVATQPTLLDQVVAKFAKSESGRVVSEVRPSEHAQPHIRVTRRVAIAVLQAETHHPTNHERKKPGIDEQSGCHDLTEDIEHIERISIGRER